MEQNIFQKFYFFLSFKILRNEQINKQVLIPFLELKFHIYQKYCKKSVTFNLKNNVTKKTEECCLSFRFMEQNILPKTHQYLQKCIAVSVSSIQRSMFSKPRRNVHVIFAFLGTKYSTKVQFPVSPLKYFEPLLAFNNLEN